MAGAGYKLFATGDVLTAAQVNTYLNEQTVMVFADSAARTTALSGVLSEGMMSYLQDTDSVEVYDGSAWTAVGGGSSPLTTKGDLYTFSTVDARLGVGANGTILTADSAETTGLKWAAPAAAGGETLISTTTLSTISTTISSIPTTYKDLKLIIRDVKPTASGYGLFMKVNADSGSNYSSIASFATATAGSLSGYAENKVATGFQLTTNSASMNNTNDHTFNIFLTDYTNTDSYRVFTYQAAFTNFGSADFKVMGALTYYNVGTAITSIDLILSGSTFAGGTAYLYGVN